MDAIPPSEILKVFTTMTFFEFLRYLAAAGVMAVIVRLAIRTRLKARKIQQRSASNEDLRREVLSSIRTVIVFGLFGIVLIFLNTSGITHIRLGYSRDNLAVSALVIVLMFIVHDTYFYWTHRAMHHRWLFKRIHLHHHRSVTPTPWAAYSFSTVEASVHAAFIPIFLIFVPMHGGELLVFSVVQVCRNVFGHCGMEFEPKGMPSHPILSVFTTTTHHDLHHCGGSSHNFGLWFSIWDRLMGTMHPRYEEVYAKLFPKE